jgi:hypothetical protein
MARARRPALSDRIGQDLLDGRRGSGALAINLIDPVNLVSFYKLLAFCARFI